MKPVWYHMLHSAEGRWETGRAHAPVKAGKQCKKGKAQGGKEKELRKKASHTSEKVPQRAQSSY